MNALQAAGMDEEGCTLIGKTVSSFRTIPEVPATQRRMPADALGPNCPASHKKPRENLNP